MTVEPYSKAQRVFVIVDNGSAHRGQRSIDRLQGAWPNLILVHTPIHASWVNQAEIYLSVAHRKVLIPNDFADLDTLEQTLLAFGRPLQADRPAVRVEVHPRRPRPPRTTTRPTHRPSRLTEYVAERPSQSTKRRDSVAPGVQQECLADASNHGRLLMVACRASPSTAGSAALIQPACLHPEAQHGSSTQQ
jgi:DDE superfamily endonuclease